MPLIITDNGQVYVLWLVITTWVFEYLVELVAIGESIIAIVIAVQSHNEYHQSCVKGHKSSYDYYYNDSCSMDYSYDARSAAILISPVFILTVATVFLATRIFQNVRLGQSRLTPRTNFIFEVSRFIAWLAITIWIIVALVEGFYLMGSPFIEIIYAPVGFFFYTVSMIHASIAYHRWRKGAFNHLIVDKTSLALGHVQGYPQHIQQGFQPQGFPPQGYPQRFPQGPPQHYPHPANGPCPCCGQAPAPDPAGRPDIRENYAPEKSQPPVLPGAAV